MFKSDEEVERLLAHKNNAVRFLGRGNSPLTRGETSGKRVLRDNEEKSRIALLGHLLGNEVAGSLENISPSQVSHYRNGHNGIKKYENPELKALNADRLEGIRTRALDKVELFLEILSTEKSLKMKGRDLASSAEKMVSIYEKLGPKTGLNIEKANIVFYAPRVKESVDYPVIDVEAKDA